MFGRSASKNSWPVFVQFRKLLTASTENQYVIIDDSKKSMKFPQIWLRDNCQCAECFHASTQSRIYQFEMNVRANKVKALNEVVEIEWSDHHTSIFDLKWLRKREFSSKSQQKYLKEFYRLDQTLWGKDNFEKIIKHFEFESVLRTNEGVLNWMEALAINGVAMIENTPQIESSVRKIAERVGFIKKTHYGQEFIVSAKPDAKNFAYLSSSLPLHTDLPYYEYKPGINLLHCLIQSKSVGGQSIIADGFYAAERLKKEDPQSFQILKETPVNWNDIGSEQNSEPFHSIFRTPVINVDRDEQYTRINHSIPQRDSHFTVDLEDVVPWYEAYHKFVSILKEETYSFKLREGQMLAFNNLRLVHGRTAYDDTETNVRHIIGAYLDWDILFARLRFLKGDYDPRV